jgi:hypothetical protein
MADDKLCIDHPLECVRGAITVYLAWFLGIDKSTIFKHEYYAPLDRLWSRDRVHVDLTHLRKGKLIIEKDGQYEFTKDGWAFLEKALPYFVLGEFGRNEESKMKMINKHPEIALVAPGFIQKIGVDLRSVVSSLIMKYHILEYRIPLMYQAPSGTGFLAAFYTNPWEFIYNVLLSWVGVPEVERDAPEFERVRAGIRGLVQSVIEHTYFSAVVDAKPSRWLIPIIPYLINMGFGTMIVLQRRLSRDITIELFQQVVRQGYEVLEEYVKEECLGLLLSKLSDYGPGYEYYHGITICIPTKQQ